MLGYLSIRVYLDALVAPADMLQHCRSGEERMARGSQGARAQGSSTLVRRPVGESGGGRQGREGERAEGEGERHEPYRHLRTGDWREQTQLRNTETEDETRPGQDTHA